MDRPAAGGEVALDAPRISLCIPTYNGATWLRETLTSACAQDVEGLEILISDDGSTDETIAIASEFVRGDARVVLERSMHHQGLVGNWNRCAMRAQGEFVKFLFQDDLLEPSALKKLLARCSEERPIVVCERKLIMADATPAQVQQGYEQTPSLDDVFGDEGFIPADEFCAAVGGHPGVNFIGEPCAVMLHRSVFERFGYFHPRLVQQLDFEYWVRVASVTGLSRVREALASFRIRPRSVAAAHARTQRFQRDVLDNLVMFHQFAFDPAYEHLREITGDFFTRQAAVLLRQARRQAKEQTDPGMRLMLEEVIQACPQLGGPIWRLWHSMREKWK